MKKTKKVDKDHGEKSELKFRLIRYDKILNTRMDEQDTLKIFGKRIQRCYGCFIAYHLKDMYLGEDVTFFCEHYKDDTMFHFDDFSRLMDISKLKEVAEADHHH